MGLDDSFHEGLKAFRDRRYQEAIQKLREAVSANEQNHKAWNALGVTYVKLGQEKEALICYENALKYDPGNLSYEQNRAQIVKPEGLNVTPPGPVKKIDLTIPYQKYLIPVVILIIVAAFAVFLVIVPSFFSPHPGTTPTVSITPVPTVLFEDNETISSTETELQSNLSSETTSPGDDQEVTPQSVSSIQIPSLIIKGDMSGKYTKGLSELSFIIVLTDGSIPQYLPRVSYLWSVGTMDPVTVLPSNPASGTIKSGDEQEVTLQIPSEQQPRAGEKYNLEIHPPTGQPAFYSGTLPDEYRGGVITNPSPGYTGVGTADSSQSGTPISNLAVEGAVNGFYVDELQELSITLREQPSGSPQDMSRITYMFTVNDGTPVQIIRVLPASGTINPGEQQLVTLTIPEDSRPRGGDTFTLDIKPDNGPSVQIRKALSSAYKGGVIP
jgi:hypothetical protein